MNNYYRFKFFVFYFRSSFLFRFVFSLNLTIYYYSQLHRILIRLLTPGGEVFDSSIASLNALTGNLLSLWSSLAEYCLKTRPLASLSSYYLTSRASRKVDIKVSVVRSTSVATPAPRPLALVLCIAFDRVSPKVFFVVSW